MITPGNPHAEKVRQLRQRREEKWNQGCGCGCLCVILLFCSPFFWYPIDQYGSTKWSQFVGYNPRLDSDRIQTERKQQSEEEIYSWRMKNDDWDEWEMVSPRGTKIEVSFHSRTFCLSDETYRLGEIDIVYVNGVGEDHYGYTFENVDEMHRYEHFLDIIQEVIHLRQITINKYENEQRNKIKEGINNL